MDGVQRTSWTLLIICVTIALLPAGAKGVSTKGNEFYFAFMGNDRARMANDQNAILFVTTEEPNPVEVTVEVNPAFYENNPDLDRNRFPQSRTQTVVAGRSVTFNFSVSANVMQTGFPDHDIRVYDLSDLDRRSGIRVSTDGGQVSVYGINNELSSIDAFSVYPCQEYPTIPESNNERSYVYVVLSTSGVQVGRESRLMVVGCQDRTTVTITPVSQLDSIPVTLPTELGAGETPSPSNPLSITIDRLHTYLLNNREDLSGTRVVSNKPIALFGGHECARVPESVGDCDHLVQQIPPEPTWGNRFFIIPVPQRYSGEYYRAATILSDTLLSVTCRTLNNSSPTTASYEVGNYDPRWGTGWIEFNTAAATSQETRNNEIQWCSVESNHPVLMMQYAQGSTADIRFKDADKRTLGDPFMTIVPPITQYGNDFTVPTAKRLRASPLLPSITIAIPLGEFFRSPRQDQTKIRLNGEVVEPDEEWVEIYCSNNEVCGYGGRIESAPEGTVTVEHTSPEAGIGVWTYGIAGSVSFGLTAGFKLDPIAFPNLEIVEDVIVSESDVEAVVRIRRIGDITSGGSRFNLRIEDGGATRGVDYRDYTVDPSDSIRRVIDADTNEIRIRTGREEVTFRFPIVNDTMNEGTEKFFLHITPIRRINVVLTPRGTVTILDSGLRIQFGLTDCSLQAENGMMSIEVVRFSGGSQIGNIIADITPMTVGAYEQMGKSIPSSYEEYDPAESSDFDTAKQRITFTRGGASEMTVQISTIDDDIREFDEAFVVVLSIVDDGGNTIQPPEDGRDVVVCTIRDDEDSVNIGISPNAVDLQESDGAVGISITKTAISECALQSVLIISDPSNVDQALEGKDFDITSVDVIVPALEAANSIPITGVTILDDSLPEVTEGFRVGLKFKDFDPVCSQQNCSHCDCCRTAMVQNIFTINSEVSTEVTIQDNDDTTIGFTSPMVVMTQEGEMIQVCAAVLAPNEIDITIPVEFVFQPDTATEEDYNLETLLESDDSELSQDQRTLCINVSIVDDVEFEGLHQFSIELQLNTSQPQVAVSPNTITVNIADNEEPPTIPMPSSSSIPIIQPTPTPTPVLPPPRPDITNVSLLGGDDLRIKWGLPDGVDLTRQPIDNYKVEVRCVGRVDSDSLTASELLDDSIECRNANTTNTEFLFPDVELRNRTYLIRVCAQNGAGETCSGYEIFTPPLPPQPEITSVSLVDGNDLDVKWRLPDGAIQPGDYYRVEVRCVGRVDSDSVTASELLGDSIECRNANTTNTEILIPDVELRNRTYIIRVCALNGAGETCSGYEIFTPPLPPQPEITNVSLVNGDDLDVKWRLPDGAVQPVNNYRVEVRCVGRVDSENVTAGELLDDSTECHNANTTNTEILIPDVELRNRTYIIRVCAQNGAGETCSGYEIFTPPLPPQPEITSVSLVDGNDLDVKWRLPDGATQPGDNYRVEVRCVGRVDSDSVTASELLDDSLECHNANTTNTEILIPDVELRNRTYIIRVCSQNGAGETCSGYEIFTPPLPPQPEITSVALVNGDDLDVKWRLPDGTIQPVDNYRVEVSCVSRVDSDSVTAGELLDDSIECRNANTTNTEFLFSDVESRNTTYLIRVCAQNGVGEICSEYDILTPLLTPKPEITSILLVADGDDLDVKWRLPDSANLNRQPVDSYRVEVRCLSRVDSDSATVSELLGDSRENKNANTTNTTTEFLFPDVELRNKTYLIRVCAVSSVEEACSGYRIFTPPLPPQPQIASVSLVDGNDLDVKWRLPGGAVQPVGNYRVEVRCVGRVDSDRVTASELLDDSVECHNANTTNTEILIPDVELRNRTYIIRVCAQNGAGETCSGYEIFTPPLPPQPEITSVSLVDGNDLDVEWRLPDGAIQSVDNYRVEVRCVVRVDSDSVTAGELLDDSLECRNANTTNTEILIPDVELRNRTYIIRVCAQNGAGETCSEYEIFTPPLPPQPEITSVSLVDGNDLDVKWRLPDGAIQSVDNYRVEVRCVGRVDSDSVTAGELLDDSLECRNANTTNTEILIPDVELRNRTYIIRVCAQNGAGETCSEYEIFTPPLPPQPEITSVSLVDGNDLDVKWRLPDGAIQSVDNYRVEVRCVGRVDSDSVTAGELLDDSLECRNANTTNTEILIPDVELRNRTYITRVCAQNGAGETCSGYEIFTPPLPPQPEITSVSLVDGNDLDVKWRLPDGAIQPVDNYRVEVRCVGRVDSESVTALELLRDSVEYHNALTGNLELKVFDITLRNKTYLIRVCALSGVGETCSGYEIFTPLLPPRPEITSVSLVDGNDLDVKWRIPDRVVQPVDNYRVDVRCVGRVDSESVTALELLRDSVEYHNALTGNLELKVFDITLRNKTYLIRVCALSGVGETCSGYEIFTPLLPPRPEITSVSLVDGNDLDVKWRIPDRVVQPVDNYRVDVRCVGRVDSESVNAVELLDDSIECHSANTMNSEALFADVELRNRTYLIRVCAQNGAGETCSRYETFTPPLPPQPEITSVILFDGDDLDVKWRLPNGAIQPVDNYEVEVRCVSRVDADSVTASELLADSAVYRNRETEDTDIIFFDVNTNNKTYIIRVCAQNRVGTTCSEYEVFTPPVSEDSSDLPPGIIAVIVILAILGCCCCWLWLVILFFCYRERQGNYYPRKKEKKYRQEYTEYRDEEEEDSEDFEVEIDEKASTRSAVVD